MTILNEAEQIARIIEKDWDFADNTTTDQRYRLHPYPARFIPEIPRELIKSLGLPKGTAILDPFSGSGTTAIEAQRSGHVGYGIDLNPIATLISQVLTDAPYSGLIKQAEKILNRAKAANSYTVPEIPNLDHWFKHEFIKLISPLINRIDRIKETTTRNALRFAFSANLVKASNQDSDTRYAAVDKKYSVHDFERDFLRTCKQLEELSSLNSSKRCHFFNHDSRSFPYKDLDHEVGLVITSPPYPNAYEYWLYHKYRMFWLGYDPLSVKEAEIGARPKYFRKTPETPEDFVQNISEVVSGINTRLHPNGKMCWVVGSSLIHGEEVDNASLLVEAHRQNGLDLLCRVGRSIRMGNKSFNLSNSRQTKEEILVFGKRKTIRNQTYRIWYHPYKYFPYEKKLAKKELLNLGKIAQFVENKDFVEVKFSQKHGTKPEHLVYYSAFSIGNSPVQQTQQSLLENSASKGKRQATRYSVHGLHEYKGKFNPQIVRGILNTLGFRNGERILDPFCGSGTTLVECALEGRSAHGTDINPLAVFLANTKVETLSLDPDTIETTFSTFLKRIRGRKKIEHDPLSKARNDYLMKWFTPDHFAFIERARSAMSSLDYRCANLIKVLLSDLLRNYSEQEPADLRIRRRKSPYPDTPILQALEAKFIEFSDLYRRSHEIVGAIKSSNKAHLLTNSATHEYSKWVSEVGQFDAVVSSPPYATALPYIDTQRLSLVWLDLLEPSELMKKEAELTGSRELRKKGVEEHNEMIHENTDDLPDSVVHLCRSLLKRLGPNDGFRRMATPALLYRYFVSMKNSLQSSRSALKPGGLLCYLLGTNQTTIGGKKTVIETPQLVADIGGKLGFEVDAPIDLEVYKRYGIHSKNAVKTEQLILLKKS